MDRGERVIRRTKSAIKQALIELVSERNYPDIKVSDITEKGNVGRSTFYKHYQSKAEVLVDIHKDMFIHLFSGLSTAESWFAPQPPNELVSFLENKQKLGKTHFSWSYKLGSDLDYLINNITLQLAIIVEDRLSHSYSEGDCNIPIAILAQSIASSYSGLIISWFTRFQSFNAYDFASYIHRIIGSMIQGAIVV